MKNLLWILIVASILLSVNVAAKKTLNVPKLPQGQLVRAIFNETNICIYRRTFEEVKQLKEKHGESEGSLRSTNDEFFIFDCVTPKGCFVSFKPKGKATEEYPNVRNYGGFIDECFGLEYDFSGRLFNSKSENNLNLKIPTHHYEKDGKVTFP